ncbi:MAG: SixA phosphatase family protein [Solirubrobacteraceae bacterium]
MPQQLWFLRHGDAEPHGARSDAGRRLTEKGEKQARVAGAALARLGLEFDAVFASPRVRALDTAKLACEALGGEPVEHEPLSGGFDREDADELLAGHDEEASLLLIGHEPDFSETIRDLVGGRVDIKKGGVAGVRVEGRTGELIALVRPSELRRISGS